ncbi:MAG: hypothetical protein QOG21_29, partial [Actinomycetota bacterium]|nr:hypothetical protein [Actinomycetota bacterium]
MLVGTAATLKEATVSVTVNDVRAFKQRGER